MCNFAKHGKAHLFIYTNHWTLHSLSVLTHEADLTHTIYIFRIMRTYGRASMFSVTLQSHQLPKLEGARDGSWDLVFALKRKTFGYCQVAKRFEQVFSHRYCRNYSLKRREADDHPF